MSQQSTISNLSWKQGIGIILGGFLFWACPEVVEDPDPPARPVIVSKSAPEAWIEQGIDADNTGKNRIVLMWRPNQEEDLAGYSIYRADTLLENGFRQIGRVDLFHTIGYDTIYYDDSLNTYVNYFYFIRARDNAGNHSLPSDTMIYQLLQSPHCIAPIDTVVGQSFAFKWLDRIGSYVYSTEYVLRLDYLDLNQTVWICRFLNNWYEDISNGIPISFTYFPSNQNGPANVLFCDGLYQTLPAGVYRWKVKAISEVDNNTNFDEASGESEWVYFSIE